MPIFDFNKPLMVPLAEMLPRIGNAWLAQYRGYGIISQWIRFAAGGGPHSHSAMLTVDDDGVLAMEVREFIGGRILPLNAHAAFFPGCIDLFSPDTARYPEFNPRGAVKCMREITERQYGYRGIVRLALRRVPFVWRFFPIDTIDVFDDSKKSPVFCSQAVSIACALGGGVDPVPRLPHGLTEPSHLTRSLFWKYEGTIAPLAEAG